MLAASVISSTLATRVKKQARQSAQKAYYTELLMSSSQKLQQGKNEEEIIGLAAHQLSIPVSYTHLNGACCFVNSIICYFRINLDWNLSRIIYVLEEQRKYFRVDVCNLARKE